MSPIAPVRRLRKLAREFLRRPQGLLAFVLLAGCATNPFADQVIGPSYVPANVFREHDTLPSAIRRLAVLPLTTVGDVSVMEFGRDSLSPVLLSELGRRHQFEIVPITPDQLRRWTGQSTWTGEEKLPLDWFKKLSEAAGVEAILVSRLTQYRAYEPLTIGWRVKLMATDDPRIIWSVDEVFDASQPSVANAARRYAQANPEPSLPTGDSRRILNSPRRFGHYTANAVFKTLPER